MIFYKYVAIKLSLYKYIAEQLDYKKHLKLKKKLMINSYRYPHTGIIAGNANCNK